MVHKYSSLIFTMLMIVMTLTVAFSFRKDRQKNDRSQQKSQPNIVYILADDMGYGDIRYLNNKSQIETPNLDKLGREGIVFTDAHSGSAVCSPTRYGILTGRYAFRSRLKKGVLGGYSPMLIEPDRFTVADLLKKAGYQTAVIGKWHLGLDWTPADPSRKVDAAVYDDWTTTENLDIAKGVVKGPNDLGFDYSYIIPSSLDIPPYIYLENGKPVDSKITNITGNKTPRGVFWRDGNGSESFKIEKSLDIFGQKAKAFLADSRKTSGKPFFLYLPLSSPHTPWLPSDKFKGKSKAGLYGDFVSHTDAVVGEVIKTLDSLGLGENTLVIFTSDNGADWKPGDKQLYPAHQANYIFRGQKSDIWEGGHHVPFIARWPKVISKGSKSAQTICLTDLLATTAAITNQKLPDTAAQDSFDFYAVLKNPKEQKTVRESIIHHSIEGMFAIRRGKWKFIDGKGSGGWSSKGDATDPAGQLYDLEADPEESKNVYDQNTSIVEELKGLLEKQKNQGFSRRL
ncbi:sulfatase-like hydrolase/transferase [Dyadobacter diqingensis]|uniref:sulfatase-like hydrolase/transferase n=1 Tax=Dyadobacter diqingensis TaxID=2938121 RepID=UPI0020C389EE|nr:sulfatase-like hydrolase/transferase [Dyadobacter diqingensis]